MTMKKITPLMQQFHAIKSQYPDSLVFFQVGDFFELFFDDAKKAASFLGITLTKRGKEKGQDIPLCGVPVHSLDRYLTKLVKGGFCVVICEQLEPAKQGTVVKRGVTKVLTPGTLTDEQLLDEKSASYILSFVSVQNTWALLFGELLTAQLYATTFKAGSSKILESELSRFFPDEIIVPDDSSGNTFASLFKKQGYFTSTITPSNDMNEWAQKQLQETIQESIATNKALEGALKSFHAYLKKNNESALSEFKHLHLYDSDDFMILDPSTQKNLELVKNNQDGGRSNTLFELLDKSKTAMGSRTLKKWLVRPLLQQKIIEYRYDAVQFFLDNYMVTQKVQRCLQSIGDIERVVGRIALRRAGLQDFLRLKDGLSSLPELKSFFISSSALLSNYAHAIDDFSSLSTYLSQALYNGTDHDWTIAEGYNKELDRYRNLIHNSQKELLALEQKEQNVTGINSLKIRYNGVQGYYIEVTKTNIHLVPERYIRRQTLVGKERYSSPELQELQHAIMSARSQSESLEHELFTQVKEKVIPHVSALRKMAHALGQIDVLQGLSVAAYERGYTRPTFNNDRDIVIDEGKHPVISEKLGSSFIGNDTALTDEQSLWVVTGPNMGGKSTYLRQVALLSIMAQCGSFLPAQSASLPLLDRIFTRIGASDNVAEGKSTFLVEMEETAHICQYATEKSLVILDEVGRGTSTFDGVAIAQAVIEYIYSTLKARCLFATHYHELTTLQNQYPGIVNYYAASRKTDDQILFLHKIKPGIAHGSFGLDVAYLAHIPELVIARARIIVNELTSQNFTVDTSQNNISHESSNEEILLKEKIKKLEAKISVIDNLNVEELTPKKAFDIIWDLKNSSL